jgi:RES domain-containing protein
MPRRLTRLRRGGTFYRVCGPDWSDASDTTFSKAHGGRWNPPGEFGALYLNVNAAAAQANARRFIAQQFGSAVQPEDVAAAYLPELQAFDVTPSLFLDAVTERGRAALDLDPTYAEGAGYAACRAVGRAAYRDGERGIVTISAADDEGEELSVFDTFVDRLVRITGRRKRFRDWYSPALMEVSPKTSKIRRQR